VCLSLNHHQVKWTTFLKDVMICSLGAYGGPEAHYGVFTDQMVTKKNYLDEAELVELIALTGILPGPSSTQTITSIGYKIGGPVLALLTLLVWALPAIVVMTIFSFIYRFLSSLNLDAQGLKYIGPMAVGFIAVAGYKIGLKVIKNEWTLVLFIGAGVITYFFRSFWVFPLVLIIGGIVAVLKSKEKDLWYHVKLNPPWRYFVIFLSLAIGLFALNIVVDHQLLYLFESFYRYGYLVIGGGQVVIPYMYTDLVDVYQYMTAQEFLTGFGIVQGIPGPMFSFSAYAGGLAAREGTQIFQVAGALVAGIGIFLPGTLLIFFIYPIWERLKSIKGIKVSLSGVTAVAGGLIAVAAIRLMQSTEFTLDNIIVLGVTILLLLTKKVPAPLIVFSAIVLGFILV
jgi:chromate transporter